MTNLSLFDKTAYGESMASAAGVTTGQFQVTAVSFETVLSLSLSQAVTKEQVRRAVAIASGVNERQVEVAILGGAAVGATRRLDATSVECVIRTEDLELASSLTEVLAEASTVERAFLGQGLAVSAVIAKAPRTKVKISQQVAATQELSAPTANEARALVEEAFQTTVDIDISNATYVAGPSVSSSSPREWSSVSTSSNAGLPAEPANTSSNSSDFGVVTLPERSQSQPAVGHRAPVLAAVVAAAVFMVGAAFACCWLKVRRSRQADVACSSHSGSRRSSSSSVEVVLVQNDANPPRLSCEERDATRAPDPAFHDPSLQDDVGESRGRRWAWT